VSGNSPSIEVLIGANADRYDAVMLEASRRMEQFGIDEKSMEDATVKASKALESQLQALQAQRILLESRPEQEKAAAIKQLKDEIEAMTKVEEVSNLTTKQHRESIVMLHEAVTGNFKGLASSSMVLAETGDGVVGTFKKIASSAVEMVGPFGIAAGALAVVGFAAFEVREHFIKLSEAEAENYHKMEELGERVGMTAEDMRGLEYATINTGTNAEQVAKAIAMFSVRLEEHRQTFAALGVTAKEPVAAFEQLIDAANRAGTESERNRILQEGLGRSWQQLVPIIKEGGAALEEAIQKGKLPADVKASYEEIIDYQKLMKQAEWETDKASAEHAAHMAANAAKMALAAAEMKKAHGAIMGALMNWAELAAAGMAEGDVKTSGEVMAEDALKKKHDDDAKNKKTETDDKVALSEEQQKVFDQVRHELAKKDLATALELNDETWQKKIAAFGKGQEQYATAAKAAMTQSDDAIRAQFAKKNKVKKDPAENAAAKAEAGAEVALDKLTWDQKVANAGEGVAKLKMVEDRRFAEQEDGFRRQYAGTNSLHALLQNAEQLHADNIRNIERKALEVQLKDKEGQIKKLEKLNAETGLKEAEGIKKLADIEVKKSQEATKARKADVKSWIDGFATVTASVNQGLAQMVMGHGSFRAQINAIWSSITQNAIMEMLKVGEEWAAKQIMERLSSKETAAENVATKQAEAAALQVTAAAANVAAVTQAIVAGAAAQAAYGPAAMSASIYSFGAADIAGTAGYNAAMATVARPSFAVGTPRVPRDMVAQIHKDEMIVPASMSESIRRGDMTLGGGGGSGGSQGGSHSASLVLGSDIIAAIKDQGHALVKIVNNHGRVSFA
jgi:hypothetical protein